MVSKSFWQVIHVARSRRGANFLVESTRCLHYTLVNYLPDFKVILCPNFHRVGRIVSSVDPNYSEALRVENRSHDISSATLLPCPSAALRFSLQPSFGSHRTAGNKRDRASSRYMYFQYVLLSVPPSNPSYIVRASSGFSTYVCMFPAPLYNAYRQRGGAHREKTRRVATSRASLVNLNATGHETRNASTHSTEEYVRVKSLARERRTFTRTRARYTRFGRPTSAFKYRI